MRSRYRRLLSGRTGEDTWPPEFYNKIDFQRRILAVGSVIVTLLALLVFGYIKGVFTTARPIRSAWQTFVVGGLAANAAFVIAKSIGSMTPKQNN